MLVEQQYAPLIHEDATVLLRPRTGLQDMTIELDPGRKDGPPVEEGATIPLAQTKPNVQPDQILASLDGDTRDYLQLLIQGGAEGLGGRGKQLSADAAPVRAARQATSPRSATRSPSGARNIAQVDHQLPRARRRARRAPTCGSPSG